jgi:regulatory protein YycH of two-component signal transduction system YycFG
MNERTIMAIILALLVIVSGVQAYKLNSLKDKIEDGGVKLPSTSNTKSFSSNTKKPVALPKSISNLPSMVGGC